MAVQTKEEVLLLLAELMPDVVAQITEKVKTALDAGAINLSDYEGQPYKPVKMILAAVLADQSGHYLPPHPTRADNKVVKNIRYFI